MKNTVLFSIWIELCQGHQNHFVDLINLEIKPSSIHKGKKRHCEKREKMFFTSCICKHCNRYMVKNRLVFIWNWNINSLSFTCKWLYFMWWHAYSVLPQLLKKISDLEKKNIIYTFSALGHSIFLFFFNFVEKYSPSHLQTLNLHW